MEIFKMGSDLINSWHWRLGAMGAVCLLLSGCQAVVNAYDLQGLNAWDDYTLVCDQRRYELREAYQGKSTDALLSGLGKPAEIVADVVWRERHFEEKWHYHFPRGIMIFFSDSYMVYFYVNEGIVSGVDTC